MNSKITLYSDKELIEQIKLYAKSKGVSVSKLTNDLFKALLLQKKSKKPNAKITNRLYGVLKDSSISKDDYKKYLEEKYL
jgi:hypothetical protein